MDGILLLDLQYQFLFRLCPFTKSEMWMGGGGAVNWCKSFCCKCHDLLDKMAAGCYLKQGINLHNFYMDMSLGHA